MDEEKLPDHDEHLITAADLRDSFIGTEGESRRRNREPTAGTVNWLWVAVALGLFLVVGWFFNLEATQNAARQSRMADLAFRAAVVDSCNRTNLVREELNKRGRVNREAWLSLATTWELIIATDPDGQHARNAALRSGIAAAKDAAASQQDVPIIDCEKAFPDVAPVSFTTASLNY